jgi:hypothetical protein
MIITYLRTQITPCFALYVNLPTLPNDLPPDGLCGWHACHRILTNSPSYNISDPTERQALMDWLHLLIMDLEHSPAANHVLITATTHALTWLRDHPHRHFYPLAPLPTHEDEETTTWFNTQYFPNIPSLPPFILVSPTARPTRFQVTANNVCPLRSHRYTYQDLHNLSTVTTLIILANDHYHTRQQEHVYTEDHLNATLHNIAMQIQARQTLQHAPLTHQRPTLKRPVHLTEPYPAPVQTHSTNPCPTSLKAILPNDKPSTKYILVGPSLLPNAGLGAFAKRNIPAQHTIGKYHGGNKVTPAQVSADTYHSDYVLVSTAHGIAIDPYSHLTRKPLCLTAYINDALHPAKWNTKFLTRNNEVTIVTTRAVHQYEELYIPYTPSYWRHRTTPKDLLNQAEHGYSLPPPKKLPARKKPRKRPP